MSMADVFQGYHSHKLMIKRIYRIEFTNSHWDGHVLSTILLRNRYIR